MPNLHHWFFWLFASLYFLHLFISIWLDIRNLRAIDHHRGEIPALFKNSLSQAEYLKSIDYTRAKTRFAWMQTIAAALLLWAFILTGAFFHLDSWLGNFLPMDSLWHQIAYPFLIAGIFYFFSLPFSSYYQFVVEERFGFNRTRPATFLLDQAKTLFLSLALGIPLVALLFWLVGKIGNHWWIVGWAVMLAFQFLVAALFPIVFAPFFYKFTPLAEGELKQRLHELAKKIQFKMSGVFTIDGSKRSSHSNAFFAGIGKTRRIVLFDTLVKRLSTDEIVSVIGHEMGHNKLKHVIKGLALSALSSLVGFFVLAYCLKWPPFFQAFGVPQPAIGLGFVLFALTSGVFTFPFNPIAKWISRKHEYEADRFSVEVTKDKTHMISSLVKLSKDNLSNLTPDRWYSFYHYSHPTTTERAAAISALWGASTSSYSNF